MKKRIFSIFAAVVMVLTLLPSAVFAEEPDYVAKINDTKYTSLQAAINEAPVTADGEEPTWVMLLKDVELDTQLNIDKKVVIAGEGHKITRKITDKSGLTAGESAAIHVSGAGRVVLANLTVVGPNTTVAEGAPVDTDWDSGQYGIKVWNANDVILNNVTVTDANAGILVSSSTVTAVNPIDVSGNEFGGIEVCMSSNSEEPGSLDVTEATIVNDTATVPAIWIDGSNEKPDQGEVVFADNDIWSASAGMQTYYVSGFENITTLFPEAKAVSLEYHDVFDSLAQAVAAANDTDGTETILLIDDDDGAGIQITDSVTIDFDGHTYTFSKDPTGSTGTETIGFQILQSAGEVTLVNGTLDVDNTFAEESDIKPFKRLIQSYADLTLEDMNLDGTGLKTDGTNNYVAAFAQGTVSVEGNTNITAVGDGFKALSIGAFGDYAEPKVTIDTEGTITGDIDVDPKNADTDKKTLLVVEDGTFTDDVSKYLSSNVEGDMVEDAEGNFVICTHKFDGEWVKLDNGEFAQRCTLTKGCDKYGFGDRVSGYCPHASKTEWAREGDVMARYCKTCKARFTAELTAGEVVKDNIRGLMMWLRTQKFDVTVAASEGGTVSFEGKKSFRYYDDVEITVKADEGYEIDTIKVDGEVQYGKKSTVKIKNIKADHKIEVTFKAIPVTLPAIAEDAAE